MSKFVVFSNIWVIKRNALVTSFFLNFQVNQLLINFHQLKHEVTKKFVDFSSDVINFYLYTQ